MLEYLNWHSMLNAKYMQRNFPHADVYNEQYMT